MLSVGRSGRHSQLSHRQGAAIIACPNPPLHSVSVYLTGSPQQARVITNDDEKAAANPASIETKEGSGTAGSETWSSATH